MNHNGHSNVPFVDTLVGSSTKHARKGECETGHHQPAPRPSVIFVPDRRHCHAALSRRRRRRCRRRRIAQYSQSKIQPKATPSSRPVEIERHPLSRPSRNISPSSHNNHHNHHSHNGSLLVEQRSERSRPRARRLFC